MSKLWSQRDIKPRVAVKVKRADEKTRRYELNPTPPKAGMTFSTFKLNNLNTKKGARQDNHHSTRPLYH